MPNAYETGERKAIPAVLVYAERGDEILMLHRDKRPKDYHAGKWNGLGGKCEPDESPLEAARRELREESGLDLPDSAFRSLGIVQFPNFKPKSAEDWLVYIFLAQAPSADGELGECAEGTLKWVRRSEVLKLGLWSGDKHFLPFVLDRKPFVATMWYENGDCVRHWLQPL